jgi:Protein of unknown function (DUF2855)
MPDFEVRRDDLRTTRLTDGEPRAESVGESEVQLQVERFGLSANNVTYGAFGDAMSYWAFFPAPDGWGRVPVWGFGDVVASKVEGIEPGERFYGYLPMSTYVTLRPEPTGGGFSDRAEHRRELPPVYNDYLRTPADAQHLDETLLLRPLFGTSFLIAAFLRDNAFFGADAVVLASASSKTAYGLAFLLARDGEAPDVIGLTSPGNREFVESLGVYDRVLTYDEASALGEGDAPLVFVDMAGDAAVRESVHRAAGDRLRHSAVVGATHWEQLGGGAELPGPAPEFFFAPTHLVRLSAELGPGELQRRLGAAWEDFLGALGGWMDIEHGEGPEAVERVWLGFVDGKVDPRRGHVLRL